MTGQERLNYADYQKATLEAIDKGEAWVDFSRGNLIQRAHEEMQEEMRVAQLTPEQRFQETEKKLRQNVALLNPKQFEVLQDYVDLEIASSLLLQTTKEGLRGQALKDVVTQHKELRDKHQRALQNKEYDRNNTYIWEVLADFNRHYKERGYPLNSKARTEYLESLDGIRDQEVTRRELQPRPKPHMHK